MHLLLTCQNRKVSRYARNARAHRGIGEENELLQDLQKVALFVPRLFVKQEQQLLKNLLKKVKEQAEKTSMTEEKKAEVADKELKDLFTAHKVKHNDQLIKELIAWKKE